MAAAAVGARMGAAHGREEFKRQLRQEKVARDRAIRERQSKAKEIIRAFDADNSGSLSPDEVGEMLRTYQETKGLDPPSDEEVEFVFKLCDVRGSKQARGPDDGIDSSEVMNLLDSWMEYLEWKDKVLKLRVRFDADHTEQLDRAETQQLLDHVHGSAVPPQVTDWVIELSDLGKNNTLCDIELTRALMALQVWERQDRNTSTMGRRIAVPSDLPKPKPSRACAVQ